MKQERWEIGSEMHWMGIPSGPYRSWPKEATWFALGRQAVSEVAAEIEAQNIWVPEYFCEDVVENWRRKFEIRRYSDSPCRAAPDFQTIEASPRDIVVAVNYFGVREGEPWSTWRKKHDCVLVEDHSHDPLSPWALASRADFAFASVRKTVPVPDGALLWSPLHLRKMRTPLSGEWSGSALKLAAMIWKADFLSGRCSTDTKSTFREMQADGEKQLVDSPTSAVSPWAKRYVAKGIPSQWRERRRDNTHHLLDCLDGWKVAQPLFRHWPQGAVPLAAVLIFPTQAVRDDYRAYLTAHNVYCPIHWDAPADASQEVRVLASRVLTIPTDQRYSSEDMERVADILRFK